MTETVFRLQQEHSHTHRLAELTAAVLRCSLDVLCHEGISTSTKFLVPQSHIFVPNDLNL